MLHSYIVELKYAKSNDSDEKIEHLRQTAMAQVRRYAESEKVQSNIKSTTLHKLVIVFKGVEMIVCEEV